MENEAIVSFFIDFYYIGYLKVLPIICVIGFILSLINIIVFLNLKQKDKIYFYLLIKSLIELLILAFGAFLPLLQNVEYFSYLAFIFQIILYKFLTNALFLYASIMEISITFNRYYIIKSTEKLLVKQKDKLIVFFFGFVSLALFIPIFFSYKKVKSNEETSLEESDFGKSAYFKIYLRCINFLENLIAVFILVPSNIVVLVLYKRFLNKKKTITNFASRIIRGTEANEIKRKSKLIKSQRKFTRMTIIMSFLFIFARLFTTAFEIFNIYNQYIEKIKTFDIYYVFLHIIISFNIYVMFGVNFFIYYFFNKPFRECFNASILFKKINNNLQ